MRHDFVLILTPLLITIGCGYTVVRNAPVEKQFYSDLEVVNVSHMSGYSNMTDDPDRRAWFRFYFRITNKGSADFPGPVGIAWTNNTYDIHWGAYPNFEFPEKQLELISPGDTVSLEVYMYHADYVQNDPIRFLLVTYDVMPVEPCKTYFPGASNISESEYSNNTFDYIIQ